LLCDVDDSEAPYGVLGEAALAADSLGRGQEAVALVVADRRDSDAGPRRDLADGERCVCHSGCPLT